jgi:hypothetical protein
MMCIHIESHKVSVYFQENNFITEPVIMKYKLCVKYIVLGTFKCVVILITEVTRKENISYNVSSEDMLWG